MSSVLYPQATGATVSSDGAYLYYQFTANGTFALPYDTVCPVLLVGGGGGGGAGMYSGSSTYIGGGGGAAGEMVYGNVALQKNVVYNVGVGSGGTGGKLTLSGATYSSVVLGSSGTNSSLFGGNVNLVANGGGAGNNGTNVGGVKTGGQGGSTSASGTYTGLVGSYASLANNGAAGNSSLAFNLYYAGGGGGSSRGSLLMQPWINNTQYAGGGSGGRSTAGSTYTNNGSGGGGGTAQGSSTTVTQSVAKNGVGGVVVLAVLPLAVNMGFNSLPVWTPPGSLASYLGTMDPDGWVICDGVTRTATDGRYTYVLAMGIGSGTANNYTPPNYRGAFFRGSDTHGTYGTYLGPNKGSSQTDDVASHTHDVIDAGHGHTLDIRNAEQQQALPRTVGYVFDNKENENNWSLKAQSDYAGSVASEVNRNSILSASTSLQVNTYGDTETRPFNFGVNWMLKL